MLKVNVLVTQSCPTLCNPMDCSLPGSSVHGLLQARILESVAIPFFRRSSWTRVSCIAGGFFNTRAACVCVLSRCSSVWLFATLWTAACQALLSIGFSGQEYQSALPFPSPMDLPQPDPEIELVSLVFPALAEGFSATINAWEAQGSPTDQQNRRESPNNRPTYI